jgi:hypothetical protein
VIIQCQDGKREVDPTWIAEWNRLYLNVDQAILVAQGWCLDNPEKRKTKRGLRAFLGNWIRRSCPLRPIIKQAQIVHDPKPDVSRETRQDFIKQLKDVVGL